MNKPSILFPVTMFGKWRLPNKNQFPDHLGEWLLDKNSLTSRLKQHCENFRVELLGQKIESCHESEAHGCIVAGEKVLVREVLLYCDDQPQVFARSLLPIASLTGAEQQLANLGTQSLGQVIFNNPSLIRESIEVSVFEEGSLVVKLSKDLGMNIQYPLWGRRSIFMLEQKPFMVAEVFLPNAFAYQEKYSFGAK